MMNVLIATAMVVERKAMQQALESEGFATSNKRDGSLPGCARYEIRGLTCFLTATGQNEAAARRVVSKALSTSVQVDLAVYVGTCAGLKVTEIGAVLVADDLIHVQSFKVSSKGIEPLASDLHPYKMDTRFVDFGRASGAVIGPIVGQAAKSTSDPYMASLRKKFESANGMDMESGGFGEATSARGVPAGVVRSVMDLGGKDRDDEETKVRQRLHAANSAAVSALRIIADWAGVNLEDARKAPTGVLRRRRLSDFVAGDAAKSFRAAATLGVRNIEDSMYPVVIEGLGMLLPKTHHAVSHATSDRTDRPDLQVTTAAGAICAHIEVKHASTLADAFKVESTKGTHQNRTLPPR